MERTYEIRYLLCVGQFGLGIELVTTKLVLADFLKHNLRSNMISLLESNILLLPIITIEKL